MITIAADVPLLAVKLAADISGARRKRNDDKLRVYAIPRGGVHALHALLTACPSLLEWVVVVAEATTADAFIDDIVDSGSTRDHYAKFYPGVPFFALVDKTVGPDNASAWVEFPWDKSGSGVDETIEGNVTRILQYIGEDVTREGLRETPARVANAARELYSGYGQDPASVLKVFTDGGGGYDEMVVVKDIPFYSACEHHMEAVFGVATIAYIPDGKIVGLSKMSRLLDIFARRLQVQERLTVQIADTLQEHLQPVGAGVLIRARHLCMERRGVCKQGHHTVTSALRGKFKTDAAVRAEFLLLAASDVTI